MARTHLQGRTVAGDCECALRRALHSPCACPNTTAPRRLAAPPCAVPLVCGSAAVVWGASRGCGARGW